MGHLFSLGFSATVFLALAFIVALVATRTSRATARRIREVTCHGRRPPGEDTKSAGVRFFVAVRCLRTRLGLTEAADLARRMVEAGYRGTLPADIYNAARILCPAVAFVISWFIPVGRVFWMGSL